MSSRTYKVLFIDNEVLSDVSETLNTMAHSQVPSPRVKALSKLDWRPVSTGGFSLPQNLMQFEIPDEWTAGDGIARESILVSVGEEDLTIVLSEGNLQEKRCGELVTRFIRDVHKRATGRELDEEEIRLVPIAALRQYICEYCYTQISDLPYTCPTCHRCFCYSHRRPESHGCNRNRKNITQLLSVNEEPKRNPDDGERPTVIVRKVPCG